MLLQATAPAARSSAPGAMDIDPDAASQPPGDSEGLDVANRWAPNTLAAWQQTLWLRGRATEQTLDRGALPNTLAAWQGC